MPSLVALAEQILENAKKLETYAASKGLPEPSLEKDAFGEMPIEQELVRTSIVDTALVLRRIAAGPGAIGTEILHSPSDVTALRVIYSYKMVHHVPLDGSTTFAEIAAKSGLSESLTKRFIRHGMANNIFVEKEPGRVSHSSITRLMVSDPDFDDDVGMHSCEVGPAFMQVPEALAKWPDSGEGNETAYTLAWPMRGGGAPKSLYEYISGEPERARRFGASMKFMTKGDAFNIKHLTTGGFSWAALDTPGATLVDVGGGHGAVSQWLASQTKNLKFIVQDMPQTVDNAKTALPAEYKDRIEFVAHDFFTPQTIKGQDIYFFRWIFHNLSDPYCLKIIEGLVPAMRKGTRIIIFEMVLPDRPATSWTEKLQFDADMIMQACFNGRERDIQAWRSLFERVSPNFKFNGVTHTPGSSFSVIDHVWEG